LNIISKQRAYIPSGNFTFFDSGGNSISLLYYPNLIVPENIFFYPLYVNTVEVWKKYEGTSVYENLLATSSQDSVNTINISINPLKFNLQYFIANIFGNPEKFYIQNIQITIECLEQISNLTLQIYNLDTILYSSYQEQIGKGTITYTVSVPNLFINTKQNKNYQISIQALNSQVTTDAYGNPNAKIFGVSDLSIPQEHFDLLSQEITQKLILGPPLNIVSSWNSKYNLEEAQIYAFKSKKMEDVVSYLKSAFSKNYPIFISFNVYSNYMEAAGVGSNSTNSIGFVSDNFTGSILGGHENVTVGIIDNVPENAKYFRAWRNQTKSEKNPPYLLLSMNSWWTCPTESTPTIPYGTSPLNIQEDGTVVTNQLLSNIFWIPFTQEFIDSVTSYDIIFWPLLGIIPDQSSDYVSHYNKIFSK
jgi:hypothetical protein